MENVREFFQSIGLNTQYDRLLALLRKLSFEKREGVLTSGKQSNFYIDCKQVSLHAEGQFLIGQLVRSIIADVAPEARGVGGMTLGADPLASAVSLTSFVAGQPLHAFIVRKESKEHGTSQWLEGTGNLASNTPVVIVEDVVTTGGSTIKSIERVSEAGFQIACVVTLVDREEGGREAIETHAPLYTLYRRGDFLP